MAIDAGSARGAAMDEAEFQRWVRLLETRTGVTVPPERVASLVMSSPPAV